MSSRRMMNQLRWIGSPAAFSATSRPARSSSVTVCCEISAIPSPAITACLMVSFVPISTMRQGVPSPIRSRNRVIRMRVPEPGSRAR